MDNNKPNNIDKLILFYDVYIVSSHGYDHPSVHNASYITNRRIDLERKVRSSCHSYRFQSKLDICKYTLASYATLMWDHVVIRYECENPDDNSDFYDFCIETFPSADIVKSRSDTAEKYRQALSKLKAFGNPWIFFSPNNDHPYVGKGKSLSRYTDLAQKCEVKYPGYVVSILYSHFTESMCSISPSQRLWGYYAGAFSRIRFESLDAYVVEYNKFMCDSILIFRLDVLLRIFTDTQNKGRVIKLEDTEFYLSRKIKHLSVLPKTELCRHYDAYLLSFLHSVPPLFIPDGFFEDRIKIRYGFSDYVEGFVNIDPTALNCRYVTGGGPDLNCLLEDIPGFWQSRISSIDKNVSLKAGDFNRNSLSYYKNLINPWHDSPLSVNILLTAWRVIKFPMIELHLLLFKKYSTTTVYRLVKRFRSEGRRYLDKYL